MTANAPTEIELLRRVASAAQWAIASNADDPVGRDGRARVGLNWIAANGTLNRALKALQEHYAIPDLFETQRQETAALEALLKTVKRRTA